MSRPAKAIVEYFSHRCRHGRVLFVMESLWGNDGYAFFYKIYELLGDSEGHVFDLNKVGNKEYMSTYTRLNGVSVDEMLTKLSNLGIIDADLLKSGLIWSQCFVDDLDSVYSRRNITKPIKPSNSDNGIQKPDSTGIRSDNGDRNPHSIVKESKRKKDMPDSGLSLFDSFYQKYPVKKAKQEAIKAWNKLKPENGTVELILSAIQKQKDANEASKKKGEFVPEWPYPATWLNGKRWEDETHTTANEDKPVFGLSPDEEKFLKEQEERENG